MSLRQYTFADILNGLNDQGSAASAPDNGVQGADPSMIVLLNIFAAAGETATTSDGTPTVVSVTPVINWDSATWNANTWQ